MSLISQFRIRQCTTVKDKEPLLYREENEIAKGSSLAKRKKDDSRRMEEEEEKKMKEHENFLFSYLYSPTKFDKEDDEIKGVETREPAWVDDQDKSILVDIANCNRLRKLRTQEYEKVISGSEYESRSRALFIKLNPGVEWAQLGALADEIDTDILTSNEDIVVKSKSKLLPPILDYSRVEDVDPKEDPFEGPINSVQFHRNGQTLLAAGFDNKLRFFQIDGNRNTEIKMTNTYFKNFPIRKAAFVPDGSQVIISARRKFFYTYDMAKDKKYQIGPLVGRDEKSLEMFEISPDSKTIAFLGNEGHILLVSVKTKELIGTPLKMNGSVRSVAFADDGRQLVSSGGDGHIYHWDLRRMRCFHKEVDEGCITGSSLGTSPNGSLLAAGSTSGIVNVYNQSEFLGGKRKPLKTIENLTTKVDFVKFNHDAQILAICSSMQKNSLKLVHVPSFSVFSNWPQNNGTLHNPRCLDFSPAGGFMAVGNAAGKIFLYRLRHYQRA
ncbi:hypothetical protein ACHQM5_004523 [Ranunculus cassubicifolius]